MTTSVLQEIEGTWLLVSMTYKNKQGIETDLYGKDPIGILTYERSGYMNAQLGFRIRKLFKEDALAEGSAEEITQAYKSYMAYYGKYHERSPGEIIHNVEGCLFPNWEGKEEIRYASLTGKYLILTTPPILFGEGEIIITAVWRRP